MNLKKSLNKYSKCPLVGKWVHKLLCGFTGESCAVTKRNRWLSSHQQGTMASVFSRVQNEVWGSIFIKKQPI